MSLCGLRPNGLKTVEIGANTLVKERSAKNIIKAVEQQNSPDFSIQPYGEGNASEIIVDTIQEQLEFSKS